MNIEEYAQLAYKNARKKIQENCAPEYDGIEHQYLSLITEFEKLWDRTNAMVEDVTRIYQEDQAFFQSEAPSVTRDNFLFTEGASDRAAYHTQLSALKYAKDAKTRISAEQGALAMLYRLNKENDVGLCSVNILMPFNNNLSETPDQDKISKALAAIKKYVPDANLADCRKTLENGGQLLAGIYCSAGSTLTKELQELGFRARYKTEFAERLYDVSSKYIDKQYNDVLINTRYEVEVVQKRKKRTALIWNIVTILILAAIITVGFYIIMKNNGYPDFNFGYILGGLLVSELLIALFKILLPRIIFSKKIKSKKSLEAVKEEEEFSVEEMKREEMYRICGERVYRYAEQEEIIHKKIKQLRATCINQFQPILNEHVSICAAKTVFLPPLVEGELLDCVIEQMEKGMATNFKDALWQATQILERKKEQERTLAREREAERERREREARRDAEERAHRQALEQYAREQAEAQQRQLAELERQSEVAKKSAEDAKKAQEEAAKEARRQTDIANEQLDLERKRETDRIWDRLHRN